MTESSEAKAVVVTPAVLQEYARAIFVGAGAPDPVARRVAGSLVLANRSGHDSHGAIRIPQYIRDVQTGQLDPRAEPAIAREGPAWVLVDGRWTFGHETARFAMAEAVPRARRPSQQPIDRAGDLGDDRCGGPGRRSPAAPRTLAIFGAPRHA